MATRNVTTTLMGRTIRFMACPNPELSEQLARIEGVFMEDGKLMLICLFPGGKLWTINADYAVVVEMEEPEVTP